MTLLPSTSAPHRLDKRGFANGALIDPGHARRAGTEAFIAQVYRARYGAELTQFLPHLLAFDDAAGRLQAAVGLRCGYEGPLFVEQYLEHLQPGRTSGEIDAYHLCIEHGPFIH